MATYSSSDKTREALVNAAGELAAEWGFDKVTTRAIAERAGENPGSLHYHFEGKENLFWAVLRKAVEFTQQTSPEEILCKSSPLLETLPGQAQLLRTMVHAKIGALFLNDSPQWACRVLYQVLRRDNPMRDWLMEEVVLPWVEGMGKIFRQIRPLMTEEETRIQSFILFAPIYFHADYMDAVLVYAGKNRFSREYFQTMEDMIVRQAQLAFGLPCDGPMENILKSAESLES